MVASPKEEEEYLMGIQDVIRRVSMFGGSAADDKVEENWSISFVKIKYLQMELR